MDIAHYIAHPDELNHETLYELRRLVAVFPAYHAARILYLRNLFLLHDPNFDTELRRAAVMLPDRGMLFNMTQQQPKTEKTEPLPSTTNTECSAPGPQKKYNATMQLLDDFLDASPKPAKRQTKIDPTVDYMSYLMQNEEEEGDHHEPLWAETRLGTPTAAQSRQDSLIDHFIDTHSERTTLSDDPMMPEGIIDENGKLIDINKPYGDDSDSTAVSSPDSTAVAKPLSAPKKSGVSGESKPSDPSGNTTIKQLPEPQKKSGKSVSVEKGSAVIAEEQQQAQQEKE